MLTKDQIIQTLNEINIKSTDTVLIHSSLKSIGKIEGNAEGLIDTLVNYLNDGLLIFPTHTWATIKNDGDVFDKNNTPSCVGMLTNIALSDKRFSRSNHPTHSVCAAGKNKESYLSLDNNSQTPVSPNGCFGALKNMNCKILFIGAPLSKITFVHSIEEEFDVKDRFTEHIYHFISKDNDKLIDYYMPRHYSKYNPHLSEHYEKLLDIMLKLNIAKKFMLGEAVSYIIDTKGCYELVCNILKKDIHAFDSFKDISNLI